LGGRERNKGRKGGREKESKEGKPGDIDYDTCSARITVISPISNA